MLRVGLVPRLLAPGLDERLDTVLATVNIPIASDCTLNLGLRYIQFEFDFSPKKKFLVLNIQSRSRS